MSDDARGQCILTTLQPDPLGPRLLRIERADPRVRICADLLQEISIATERGEADTALLVGDVLTLRGVNRTVVYRVDYTDYDPSDDSYGAEWPD